MKKIIYILNKLTRHCYIALLLPYCNGTALPQKGLNSPHTEPFLVAPSSEHMASTISWLQLAQLMQEGDQYHDNNQYFESIEIYKEALQKYMQNYTKKTLLLAQLYNNMGMSYLALRDYTQTEFCYNKALTIRQTLLDKAISSGNASLKKDISEVTGKSHHNLGILYLELKQPSEAILSFEAALKTQWQYHEEAMDTQFYLASTYQQVERYQASKKLYEVILDRQAKTSYLQPTAIVIIEKYVSQVNEKIENMDEISPLSEAAVEHNDAMVLHQPQLPKKSLFPSPVGLNEVAEKEGQPSHSPPLKPKKSSFSCDQCGRLFRYKSQYLIHMPTHTGEKPFSCPLCDKKFARKYSIKKHMHVHTEEKPFVCTVCKKKFSQKQHIKNHMRVHTGEKPFVCTVCKKKFSQKQHLKSHMRVHTGEKPFACTVCKKKFSQKHHMKDHMRVHTGERPFICTVCNKKFSQKQHMKTHMDVHTGEKRFTCSVCDKKFTRKDTMQKHHKRIHK